MNWQIRKLKEDIIGAIIGIFIGIVIITYVVSQQDFIEENEVPKEPIQVINGYSFEYCRTVTYLSDSILKLDKALVRRKDTGEVYTLSYPSHSFTRKEGDSQKICKIMILPTYLEYGQWTIETYLTKTSFNFWKKTIKLQDIYLNVRTGL